MLAVFASRMSPWFTGTWSSLFTEPCSSHREASNHPNGSDTSIQVGVKMRKEWVNEIKRELRECMGVPCRYTERIQRRTQCSKSPSYRQVTDIQHKQKHGQLMHSYVAGNRTHPLQGLDFPNHAVTIMWTDQWTVTQTPVQCHCTGSHIDTFSNMRPL